MLWSHLVAIKAVKIALRFSETGLRTAAVLEHAIHDFNAVIGRLRREGESNDVGLRLQQP